MLKQEPKHIEGYAGQGRNKPSLGEERAETEKELHLLSNSHVPAFAFLAC